MSSRKMSTAYSPNTRVFQNQNLNNFYITLGKNLLTSYVREIQCPHKFYIKKVEGYRIFDSYPWAWPQGSPKCGAPHIADIHK
jgi:hypothetical protein